MYLAKQLTSRSLPEIGRRFGNRDHTTVMHAVSRVTELMERDAQFAEDVERLQDACSSPDRNVLVALGRVPAPYVAS